MHNVNSYRPQNKVLGGWHFRLQRNQKARLFETEDGDIHQLQVKRPISSRHVMLQQHRPPLAVAARFRELQILRSHN